MRRFTKIFYGLLIFFIIIYIKSSYFKIQPNRLNDGLMLLSFQTTFTNSSTLLFVIPKKNDLNSSY